MGRISYETRSDNVVDKNVDLSYHVELRFKRTENPLACFAIPTPNPWGLAKCEEVYTLVWREEYDYLPGDWLGFLTVDGGKVRYSFIKNRYRSMGLGSLMYELALLTRGSLSTDYYAASERAKKVWDNLKLKYDHETKPSLTILV
jgi:hypothetical protein